MGLSVWSDCALRIVSVLRREFGLEGLRHSGYVRASVRRGEFQLVGAGITTPGGQTSSQGDGGAVLLGKTESTVCLVLCISSLDACLSSSHTKLFRMMSEKPVHLEETI